MKEMRCTIVVCLLLLVSGCTVMTSAPSRNPAVTALLEKAEVQTSAGQLNQADASLERALRIEPRNPALWQQLARLRFEQGLFSQAENLARKSNSLAAGNRSLRKENWNIIAQARNALGDVQGAQQAWDRAAWE